MKSYDMRHYMKCIYIYFMVTILLYTIYLANQEWMESSSYLHKNNPTAHRNTEKNSTTSPARRRSHASSACEWAMYNNHREILETEKGHAICAGVEFTLV